MNADHRKSDWTTLEGIKAHFSFHTIQRDLFDVGLEQRGTDGPAFIILHTGAALRPDGAAAKRVLLEATLDQVQQHKAESLAAQARAEAWNDIHDRIATMNQNSLWKNPMWEREILKGLKDEIKAIPGTNSPTKRHGDLLFGHKFRRGFTYRDVVCVHEGKFCAFKVDREKIDHLFTLKGRWDSIFPEIDFTRKVFKWMVFPKDLSGGSTIAYLQFGNMAFSKAGGGHVRRYDFSEGLWRQGETVESWRS